MFKRIANLSKGIVSQLGRAAKDRGQASCNFKRWQKKAQLGELAFHRQDTWRPSENFVTRNASLLRHFGFRPDEFAGKTIIDVGAGSKLRTKYFSGSKLIIIEPLADRFRATISWSDVGDADEMFSVPAEEYVAACEGRGDLIISINALDHCFDFARIIANLSRYASSDGLIFLSFDKHTKTDALHPLSLTEQLCDQVFEACGLSVERFAAGFGESWDGPPTYGHGPYAMNYWLRRARAA
jgi:2-polyprenyl-3-methyl-5-hydroxy-6-metoxy-1,4-benzoquinol methylase